ncbi:TfoX/Sxy family DNA transformation protein [Rosenbergiella australiborealis]|uniref:TfoX/Sxy family DNA transformation protein n=1 Tax=Rosenbergiella australiborealis TaxID=1544696 RepID=A0ABS5T3J0_9GAMM|nr:TfoX/Sxy family DNA transformation protein [Rosenbergiella australiborealis]MBT0726922.1 TfoX/Sxy family DNA transformation protein [Rosenbergiella australiborealis]
MNCSQQCIARYKEKVGYLGNIVPKTQFGGYSLSIDHVVFALVKQDAVYLRGSEAMSLYLANHQLAPFIFTKRGTPVSLNYFRVNDPLWQDEINLLKLSRAALQDARNCLNYKQSHRRLKDLPNLGIRFETLLKEVGIHTEDQLRQTGVVQCWALMHQRNKHLGLSTLFYLQGAVMGIHHAVLPVAIKQELIAWHTEFISACRNAAIKQFTQLRVAL